MAKLHTVVSRPDPEAERKSQHSNICYSRNITYQECVERGLDPAKYGLTPDSIPDEPKVVNPSLNKKVKKGKHSILPNRPPRNPRILG